MINKQVLGTENFNTITPSATMTSFSYSILDNKVYVFSGGSSSQYASSNPKYIYVYDLIDNEWRFEYDINMPSNITMGATCTFGKEIYFFGGYNNTNVVSYNPYSKTWQTYDLGGISSMDTANYIFSSKILLDDSGYGYFAGFSPVESKITTEAQISRYNFKTNQFEFYSNDKVHSGIFHINKMPSRKTDTQYTFSAVSHVGSRDEVFVIQVPRLIDEHHYINPNSYVPHVCFNIDEEQLLDLYVKDGTVKINVMKYENLEKPILSSEMYEPVNEYIPDDGSVIKNVTFPWGIVNSSSNTDDAGNLYVPVFTSDGKLGIISVYQPEYITNSEQLVEMTAKNELDKIKDMISAEIYCTEPANTSLRFAFSVDGRNTYKYFDFATDTWKTVTDKKKLLSSGEGMSVGQVESLTKSEWALLIKDGNGIPYEKLNIAVTLFTSDLSVTPTISEIRFRTIKVTY